MIRLCIPHIFEETVLVEWNLWTTHSYTNDTLPQHVFIYTALSQSDLSWFINRNRRHSAFLLVYMNTVFFYEVFENAWFNVYFHCFSRFWCNAVQCDFLALYKLYLSHFELLCVDLFTALFQNSYLRSLIAIINIWYWWQVVAKLF